MRAADTLELGMAMRCAEEQSRARLGVSPGFEVVLTNIYYHHHGSVVLVDSKVR